MVEASKERWMRGRMIRLKGWILGSMIPGQVDEREDDQVEGVDALEDDCGIGG